MNAGQIVLLTTYLFTAAVLVGSGIPLYRRKVGPNKLFGLRTKLTMSDDEIWFAANQVAGRWLIITGIGTAASAVAGMLAGMNETESATLVTGGMLTGISLCVIASLAEQRRVIEKHGRTGTNDVEAHRQV
ncbi:MAG: putative membrane protein [Planctomycetaceae bacterium]|jgi:uncharacterized membrane protein